MRSGVLLRPPVSAGVLEPLKKMGGTPGLKKVNELVCSKRDHSHFCNGSSTPACAAGGGKNATTHNGGEPFAPGKSRIGFYSHRECMEETHEYANELGKQGRKNPRKIPKFSINHERSSRTIEKKSKITPTHSSDGILKRLFVLKTRPHTQRATKVKKFVGFSLKPVRF